MKKILYVLILFFIASCQRQQKKEEVGYKVSGQIKNAPDSTSVIISNEHFKDSTVVISGKFSFSGSTDMPRKIILSLKNASQRKIFWLENAQITINGDYNNLKYAQLTGGENQKVLNLFLNKKKPIQKLIDKYSSQWEDKSLEKPKRDSIKDTLKLLSNKYGDIEKKFVREYPNTLESVILLAVKRNRWNKDTVITIFSTMNKEIKNTEFGILISEYLKLPITPDIGDKYVDVELKNTDEETVALSQLMRSYTLVDFWASWCVPCREENPNLIEAFKKYNNRGFNIIGVSMDREKSKWLKAIKDDELPWDNLTDSGDLLSNSIFMLYNVGYLPDNILIDEKGIIIARNMRGDELKEKLQELFKF